MSQNGQTHFKSLAANAFISVFDHFGTLCIKGLKALFKIFKFLFDFLVMYKKWLDYKDKVNFEIYDITAWLANNNNALIDYWLYALMNESQPDNENWSVNSI